MFGRYLYPKLLLAVGFLGKNKFLFSKRRQVCKIHVGITIIRKQILIREIMEKVEVRTWIKYKRNKLKKCQFT